MSTAFKRAPTTLRAVLGWLIDPDARRVQVFRPGREVETLEAPVRVVGDPELPGLVVELDEVW